MARNALLIPALRRSRRSGAMACFAGSVGTTVGVALSSGMSTEGKKTQ
jgi:hypothetical protein